MKPYFEFIRVGLDERTDKEMSFNMLMRWDEVDRIEDEVGHPFSCPGPLTIIVTKGGDTLWVQAPYNYVAQQYKAYLDGYLVHSPLRN